VERIDRGRLLRLRAEMRAPGRAWLELMVEPEGNGSLYRQRAIFFPKGLSGKLYWLAVLPFHSLIFPAMSRNIAAAAQRLAETEPGTDPGTGPERETRAESEPAGPNA